jgi:hypothetical protein
MERKPKLELTNFWKIIRENWQTLSAAGLLVLMAGCSNERPNQNHPTDEGAHPAPEPISYQANPNDSLEAANHNLTLTPRPEAAPVTAPTIVATEPAK